MKLLDVVGTNSENFSIGLGEKKIEFKSFNGVFYFRNFGEGWQKASSELLKESIKLRNWNSGIVLNQGELFTYNNSIWSSNITLESTNFSNDCKYFIKIADLLNFTKLNVNQTTHLLSVEHSDIIYIEGTSSQINTLILPDATTLNLGRNFIFINASNTIVNIFKRNTNQYDSINPNESISLILTQNLNITGVWSKINFGGGGEVSTSNKLNVILNLNQYPGNVNPFVIGDLIYYNVINSKWEKAYAGNFDLNILGIISDLSGNLITINFFGEINFQNPLSYNNVVINSGSLYYLTDIEANAGQLTDIPPLFNPKKILIAISTTRVLLLDLGQNIPKRFDELIINLNLANYGGTNPFTIGNFVYFNESNSKWEKAYSSNFNIGSVGMVTYSDTNAIKLIFEGPIELPNTLSVTPGLYYYLTSNSLSPGEFISTNEKNEKRLFLAISTKIIILLNEPNENRFKDIKTYTLSNGQTQILNNSETGLVYKIEGYVYNDNNFINFYGIINNGINVNAKIQTDSPLVFNRDTTPGLCFFESGNNLVMKNNLGSTKTIIITREKIII